MLSKSEKKVLSALCYNGRATLSELSKLTKLTRQTVYKALKKLNENIVNYYGPMFNPDKVGLEIRAFILISSRRKDFHHLEGVLTALDEVSQAHEVLGRYDLLAEVLVPHRKDLTRVLNQITSIETVMRTETLLVTTTVKFDTLKPIQKALALEEPV